jgi:phosphatidylglycerol:prolipoprotein diacylglycerol transferase
MAPLLDPIAISIGIITVHWYGIILAAAALGGLILAIMEGKRFRIAPEFFMDLVLYGVPSAVIAARIYYVAFQWEDYKDSPSEIIAVWHGGIAIHGALIGAVIAGVIYTRIKKVSFWRIADICAPGLIVGQMIGRWGNFVNQEAHGGPVDRDFLSGTLHLPDWLVNHMQIGESFYHPTFLYESIWNLLGVLFLIWLRRKVAIKAGELFLSYLIWYSVGRFFIEGLRTDSLAFQGPEWAAFLIKMLWAPMDILFDPGHLPEGGGNIRIAQLIGLIIIIGAILLMVLRRRNGQAQEYYKDPITFGGNPSGGSGGPSTEEASAKKDTDPNEDKDTVFYTKETSTGEAQKSPSEDSGDKKDVEFQERLKPGNPFL